MRHVSRFARCDLSAVVALCAFAGCGDLPAGDPDDGVAPTEGRLAIDLSVSASGLADSCYDVRVQVGGDVILSYGDPSHASESGAVEDPDDDDEPAAAIARGALCASEDGVGNGHVRILGPCRPGETHEITAWVHNLYTAGSDLDETTWNNPCGSASDVDAAAPATWGGGCTLQVECAPGTATPVVFDLAIARTTTPGFYGGDELQLGEMTCIAKVVTCHGANAEGNVGGEPIEMLVGSDGESVPTVVAALTCIGPADSGVILYSSDLTITCEQDGSSDAGWQAMPRSLTLSPAAGEGVISSVPDPDMLAAWGIFSTREDFDGSWTGRTWTVALALTTDGPGAVEGALAGYRSCGLTAQLAAATGDTAFSEESDGFAPVDDTVSIRASVRLTDGDAQYDCRDVRLGSVDPDGADYDLAAHFADTSMRWCHRLGPGEVPETAAGCSR